MREVFCRPDAAVDTGLVWCTGPNSVIPWDRVERYKPPSQARLKKTPGRLDVEYGEIEILRLQSRTSMTGRVFPADAGVCGSGVYAREFPSLSRQPTVGDFKP